MSSAGAALMVFVALTWGAAYAAGPPVQAVGGVSLPAVPAALTAEAGRAAAATRESNPSNTPAATSSDGTDSNIAVTVTPGATEIIRIAAGFLNQIVTPFDNPKLLSVNPIEVQKEGASLYVATSSSTPIGVNILSNDPEDTRSISLTLIPARVPPRTVTLKWPGHAGELQHGVSAKARHWEEAGPYEEKLLELVQVIARGEIPDGYALAEQAQPLPCALAGVKFVSGQRLTGTHFSVFVLRATNTSSSTVEIESHGGCNLPGVVLVAPWPQAYLDPGASTELYVAVANEAFEPRPGDRIRPSLLSH